MYMSKEFDAVESFQAKWNALRDAADAYSELNGFSKREKQWLLQRVSLNSTPLALMGPPHLSQRSFWDVCS